MNALEIFAILGSLTTIVGVILGTFLHLLKEIKEIRKDVFRLKEDILRLEMRIVRIEDRLEFSGKTLYIKEKTEEEPKEN